MPISPDPSGPIVVGVDGSPASNKALRWAAKQAKMTGSTLLVVTTWTYPKAFGTPVGVADNWRPDLDAEKVQKDAVSAVSDALDGVVLEGRVVEGDAALSILGEAEGASLIVIGSRGHREITGFFLGSVSEYLVTHAKLPVVVIHAD